MRFFNPTRIGQMLILLSLVFYPVQAFSCTCDVPDDVTRSLKIADVVFLGKAESVVRIPPRQDALERHGRDFELDETTFTVHDSWKGVRTSQVVSRIYTVCCLCGFEFKAGETYLVYGQMNDDGTISTSICSRTTQWTVEHARHFIDIKVLNRLLGR